MKFVNSPCDNCPFKRGAFPTLESERRAEIADGLISKDNSFTCHKHISGDRIEDEDGNTEGYKPGAKDVHCAGALIVLKKSGHLFDNFLFRLAAMTGMFDPDKLNMDAPVYDTIEEFIEGK